jgi:hypothetical protein
MMPENILAKIYAIAKLNFDSDLWQVVLLDVSFWSKTSI